MFRRLKAAVKREPRWVVAALALLFVVGSVRYFGAKRSDGQPEARIGTDGRYYWAVLTSLALDRDLDFTNQYANPESGNYFKFTKTETGRYANPYPIGAAILWMPFFAVAHGVSLAVEPAKAADGTSFLTQQLTLYGSFVYGFLALLLAYAMAKGRYGPGAALAGATAALIGGPLIQYTLNQPAYAHAASAFAIAAMFLVWDRGRGQRTLRGWLLLGALVGLATLIRSQNAVFAAPALAEAIWLIVRAGRGQGAKAAARAALYPLAGGVVALCVFAPQMIMWKVIFGSWITIPSGSGYMRWSEPLWSDSLFSSRNGLFPYAPLWALGLLGLVPVIKRDRALGAALLGTFVLITYINGASADAHGSGGFGGRRFDGLVVHVALGLAAITRALAEWIERRPRAAATTAVVIPLAFFATCSYLMSEEYRRGRLHPSEAKDMLTTYDKVGMRAARRMFTLGNPLSWPAAWAFAARTGAPASSYDVVVGTFFLTDTDPGKYRAPSDKTKDDLELGAAGDAKYLVRGFGAVEGTGATAGRTATGRARLLVPFNHPFGVTLTLHGRALGPMTVRLYWNGAEVGAADVQEGEPIALEVSLTPEQVGRGVNIVEIAHDGVPPGEPAAFYTRLSMTEVR